MNELEKYSTEDLIAELTRRGENGINERYRVIASEYIQNDLDSADPSYVRDVLVDMIGVSRTEADELGVGWVFEE